MISGFDSRLADVQAKRRMNYSSVQFTLADLRLIVEETNTLPAESEVNLTVSEPYRGEFGRSTYYIEIES